MYNHTNPKNGERANLVADDVYQVIMEVRIHAVLATVVA